MSTSDDLERMKKQRDQLNAEIARRSATKADFATFNEALEDLTASLRVFAKDHQERGELGPGVAVRGPRLFYSSSNPWEDSTDVMRMIKNEWAGIQKDAARESRNGDRTKMRLWGKR